MSRLDYLTIGIVIVCIAALGFLVWRTISLMDKSAAPNTPTNTITTTDGTPENYEEGSYEFDDEGEIIPEDADLDDEEVTTYNEDEISDEPIDESGVDLERGNSEEELEPEFDEEEAEEETDNRAFVDSDASGSGDYLVLAGSFRVLANAESEVRRLQRKGYDKARVALFNNGAYAGVLVDRFENLSEANSLKKELKNSGIEALVQKKRGN